MIWIEVYNAHRDITQLDLMVLQLKRMQHFSKFILGVPVLRRGKPHLRWTLSHLQRELIIANTPIAMRNTTNTLCEIQCNSNSKSVDLSTEEQGSGFDPLLCAAVLFSPRNGGRANKSVRVRSFKLNRAAMFGTVVDARGRNSRQDFCRHFWPLDFRAQEPVNQKGAVLAPQPSSPVCYISLQAWIY